MREAKGLDKEAISSLFPLFRGGVGADQGWLRIIFRIWPVVTVNYIRWVGYSQQQCLSADVFEHS